MGVVKLSQSGLRNFAKYSSMLAGNGAFSPSSYDLLTTTTLTSSAASVTFSGLGAYSGYKHLQLRMITASTRDGGMSSYNMRFNSDSGANYSRHALNAGFFPANSGVTSNGQTAQTGIASSTWARDYSNHFWPAIWDILDFSSTNKNTTVKSLDGSYGRNNFNHSPEGLIRLTSGAWYNTSAVTSISLVATSDAFEIGSRFSLIGLK